MTPVERYGGILWFFLGVFLRLKKWSTFTEIGLDLAATLFTPEPPKVFYRLKHFTHPSIGIVVSR